MGHHYVQAPLIDQHHAEEAVIVQCVGDIPSGSPDRLVLVDITCLDAGSATATHQRTVHLMPRYLTRTGALTDLRLGNPRVAQPDACTLHFDNVIWESDDLFPCELHHGTYLRIEVRPQEEERLRRAPLAFEACDKGEQLHPSKRSKSAQPASGGVNQVTRGTSLFQHEVDLQLGKSTGAKTHSATFPSLAAGPRATTRNPST